MPAINETKERLGAASDTKKITQSLQLVAASRMKFFQNKAVHSRDFSKNTLRVLKNIGNDESFKRLYSHDSSGPVMFLLMSSNKGLCGSLNNRLSKRLFNSDEWLSNKNNSLLVTIGKKSLDAARVFGVKPTFSFKDLGENLNYTEGFDIASKIFLLWEEYKCSKIYIVYPEYISAFENKIELTQYLPVLDVDFGTTDKDTSDIIMEPNKEHVIESLFHMFVGMKIVSCFFDLKAAEYSSRMISMKKATDAANDMIDMLTLEYNKARQGKITQEISELAGAQAAQVSVKK